MGNNLSNLSDSARANKLARLLQTVVVVILTISYIFQGMKNDITIVQLAFLFVSLWIPVILAFIIYKKNNESYAIRHIIGIGYGFFYIAICLISEQRLVFTYAFPMILVVSVFSDYAFSKLVSICISIIAIVHAVFLTYQADFSAYEVASMTIEIAATILVCVYSTLANKFVFNIAKRNVEEINKAASQTQNMLDNIMEISNSLVAEVQEVSEKMEILSISSNDTLNAMNEVQQGSSDSAEAVQQQLYKTEEIQNYINNVTSASANIDKSVDVSIAAISQGRENVNQLISNAEQSEKAGNDAVNQLTSLKEYAEKMETIIELIQGVATQTNLLSLNASIEAARAGEAGRGFAVVASEISNLASQTQNATEDIDKLIENITTEVDNVAKAIGLLIESNQVQSTTANVTASSFEKIESSTNIILSNSGNLTNIVSQLEHANNEIVSNIQTVSAITEEVSAHTITTCEKTEQNEKIVSEVQSIVEQMISNAEQLKQL